MRTRCDDALRQLAELDDEGERRRLLTQILREVAIDDFVPRLKDESERYLAIDPRIALRLAEALIQATILADRPDLLPFGTSAKGDALRFLGRYPESLAMYDAAGEQFLAHHNEVGWARTRANWIMSSHFLGKGVEALSVVESARKILLRHGEWLRAGALSLNAGIVCAELGRNDPALRMYARAMVFYKRARRADPLLAQTVEIRIARAKMNSAEVLIRRGDFRRALAFYQEAREVFVRHSVTVSVLLVDQNVADIYALQGHYPRALRLYSDVLQAMERADDELNAALFRLSMVECYLSLNRSEDALELATQAERVYERCETPTELAKARVYQALALARLGDVERALVLLEQADEIFRQSGLLHFDAIASLQRAGLYLQDQSWLLALAEAERAGQIFAEQKMIAREAQARLVQARAALGVGETELALSLARSALASSEDYELHWLAQEAHHLLALLAREQGDAEAALRECQQAIASIEWVQSRLDPTLRISFLEDKLAVYHDAVDLALQVARPAQAFALLEQAKSRALVDYLGNNLDIRLRAHSPADQGLLDELVRLREEHNWLANRLQRDNLTHRLDGAANPCTPGADQTAELADLRAAVHEREKQIGRIVEQLAIRGAEERGAVVPLATASDPMRDLDEWGPEGALLLEYYLRPDGGRVFVVSPSGIQVVDLTVPPAQITRLLAQWHLNLTATGRALAEGQALHGLGRNARGILEALYQALVQPVEQYLDGIERLVVVPYGPIHAVPFHALHDGRRFLIERFEVPTGPSSSLLGLCSRRPGRPGDRSLVVAHSDDGRLTGVVAEAREVAALLPGACYLESEATRAAVIAAAPRHAVIHLASHAEARLDNPVFAHLKLADGQLSTLDVFNLQLDGALVTLSGCETGRGQVAAGDELIGLSRAFLFAGAKTLVQSLWQVEDSSTARLMGSFYRGLRAGLPAGAALRQAQLAGLAERSEHPYFWGAFQLVGDGGTRLKTQPGA